MWKKITLEVSLKPFKKTDTDSVRTVCEKIYDDWAPLLRGREVISILMWCSDGSEILDYSGRMNDEFEWCYFLGTANLPILNENEDKATSLHIKKQLYTENPPKMTYEILASIIKALKEEGKRRFPNAKILVGETFDIGPEFAISSFKYERHREITSGNSSVDGYGFIDATAELHADRRRYAAYPDGIPEGTPFGRFLGKQAQIFLTDMGFDYIWLSNGLGFSADPWESYGKIYDGEDFYPERLNSIREKVFKFWEYFTEGCSFPLEVRGTNNSVGIDYATDGVPLYQIYRAGFNILPPPNSPWAAINGNYGLELMGHMTRICELPSEEFLFRFYLHDPWWLNSPWYDRYGSSPQDIYLPMAISRIDESGKVRSAGQLNLLSIDNSWGDMPAACIYEPLPHLLKAEKNAPDEIAPLVWVYPMREYTSSSSQKSLSEMLADDKFIELAINSGFPLNCVSSTDAFLKQDKSIYRGSVIITPVPRETVFRNELLSFAESGGKVIVTGSTEAIKSAGLPTLILTASHENVKSLFDAISKFGYEIKHGAGTDAEACPVTSIHRADGGYFVSQFNRDTTKESFIKLPIGAPIPIGAETEIEGGMAKLRLPRFAHMECRVFVEMDNGTTSCTEMSPVNTRFRRKILVRGLKNATVRLYTELGTEHASRVGAGRVAADATPVILDNFKLITDESGSYLLGENISGDIQFLLGKRE